MPYTSHGAHDDHEGEHGEQDDIASTVNVGTLRLGRLRIHHDLGLPARIHHKRKNPRCVSQDSATQQHHVVVYGHRLALDGQFPQEGIQPLVWRLVVHLPSEGTDAGGRSGVHCEREGRLDLEIGLAVQVAGVDVAVALLLARRELHHIRGEGLPLVHAQNISDLDVLPRALLDFAAIAHDLGDAVVHSGVISVAF